MAASKAHWRRMLTTPRDDDGGFGATGRREGHGSRQRRGGRVGQRADEMEVCVLTLGWFVDLTQVTGSMSKCRRRARACNPKPGPTFFHHGDASLVFLDTPSSAQYHSQGIPSVLPSTRTSPLSFARVAKHKAYPSARRRVFVFASPPFSQGRPIPLHSPEWHLQACPCLYSAPSALMWRDMMLQFLGRPRWRGKGKKWERCAVFVACQMCHLM
ncbi:hypothetical protein IWZ00DRAFT_37940 [Phyllosticta capitalensis]|uniref:Uncharacterized protein n=1 Tax=Phyllosticta capitalensis TaxID=121624 RepID=A0ABR1Z490_9PEZI